MGVTDVRCTTAESARIRVLLVGGDAETLERARACLPATDERRFEVDLAPLLEAGLSRVAAGGVDVVLVDPRRSGSEARAAIDRLAAEAPDVPVVACGLRDETEVLEALNRGAAETVVEGDRRSLARCVLHAIERQRLRTRLAEATRSLAASEAHLRTLVGTCMDGIVVVDPEGTILFRNPAADRCLGAAHGAGRTDRVSLPAAVRDAAGGAVVVETVRPDGAAGWTEVRTAPFRWEGKPALLVCLRDVTDIRRAEETRRDSEERLRQAQRMEAVGMLAGGLAHDFNNLLTVVLGASQLVRHRLGREGDAVPASVVSANLELIDKTAQRAAILTRQLLAISRRSLLKPRIVDVSALLEEIAPLLRAALGAHVALELRPGASLGRVFADPGNLEQIVMNLAVNARDAMPRGGRLTLATADVSLDEAYAARHAGVAPGPYVLLSVADTGTGIDSATLEHVFEPFFTTKGPGMGTGLGLSIVYGIVKQGGGHVAVESRPGEGTTFLVYLPLAKGPDGSVPVPPPEGPPAGGIETVLVVESEPALRALARETLAMHGYRILDAGDGEHALEACGSHGGSIHLLVTDVVLPGIGGQDLSERFLRQRPNAAVLFTSGFTDSLMVDRGLLERGRAYLQKPYTPVQLARRVRAVLDERAAGGARPPA